MQKTQTAAWVLAFLLPLSAAAADVKIAADTSGLPSDMVANLAASAKSMGVQEPVSVSVSNEGGTRYAVITGTSAARCRAKLSNANPPTMLGLSCR